MFISTEINQAKARTLKSLYTGWVIPDVLIEYIPDPVSYTDQRVPCAAGSTCPAMLRDIPQTMINKQ